MASSRNGLDELVAAILSFARLEFDAPLDPDEFDGELRVLAAGIKMLGEELLDRIVSRAHLQRTVDAIGEMTFVLDLDRGIESWNPAVATRLGYGPHELLGMGFDGLQCAAEASLPPGAIALRAKDGTVVPVMCSESVVLDDAGMPAQRVCLARDISDLVAAHAELQRTTAQLVQSAKLSALGEMAAGVAHELNQPLNIIGIVCQNALRELPGMSLAEGEIREQFTDIRDQVRKMAAIIDHMRLFSRNADPTHNDVIDVAKLCRSALMLQRQQLHVRNIELVEEIETGLPSVIGNSVRIEQVLVNLIVNARSALEHARKPAKRLAIRARALKPSESPLARASVAVEIEDNGDGMCPEVRARIFEPFFTTKEPGEGTGLGLSICRTIVEEHQGTILVKSCPGEGALFEVVLPQERGHG